MAPRVVDYLKRAAAAGLGWPIPEELGEHELGGLPFSSQVLTSHEPSWAKAKPNQVYDDPSGRIMQLE